MSPDTRAAPPEGDAATSQSAAAKPLTDALSLRWSAALRCEPMPCGHRDPLLHATGLANDQLDAWRAAEAHLRAAGLVPVMPLWVWRALREVAA